MIKVKKLKINKINKKYFLKEKVVYTKFENLENFFLTFFL